MNPQKVLLWGLWVQYYGFGFNNVEDCRVYGRKGFGLNKRLRLRLQGFGYEF